MSFDEQHLRIENARLREEIDRISGIAAKYVGKPTLTYPDVSSHGPSRLNSQQEWWERCLEQVTFYGPWLALLRLRNLLLLSLLLQPWRN
ncbi:hypothetical protein HanPSC8_Chr05g0187451 [Helianthus annuus]|nr:hypothetical protein HanPSC8_Chr05g0187451 [Helianthus annuus]